MKISQKVSLILLVVSTQALRAKMAEVGVDEIKAVKIIAQVYKPQKNLRGDRVSLAAELGSAVQRYDNQEDANDMSFREEFWRLAYQVHDDLQRAMQLAPADMKSRFASTSESKAAPAFKPSSKKSVKLAKVPKPTSKKVAPKAKKAAIKPKPAKPTVKKAAPKSAKPVNMPKVKPTKPTKSSASEKIPAKKTKAPTPAKSVPASAVAKPAASPDDKAAARRKRLEELRARRKQKAAAAKA